MAKINETAMKRLILISIAAMLVSKPAYAGDWGSVLINVGCLVVVFLVCLAFNNK